MENNNLPRGLRNNNPLNIRLSTDHWQGMTDKQTDSSFVIFKALEYGLRAAFIILKKYLTKSPHADTIEKIVSRWAPANENDTEKYIAFVEAKTGIKRHERLKWTDKNKLCRIVHAMCIMENGQEIQFGRIEYGYGLANNA